MNECSFYVIGGAISLDDQTYVERDADDDLYTTICSSLHRDRVCFILAPRQTGKTSLMVRTAKRFRDQSLGVCVQINLQKLGTVQTEADLLLCILSEICGRIHLENDIVKLLDADWQSSLQPTLKFEKFLTERIIPRLNRKLVIFLDEIQTLLNWKLQGSFLGFMKALQEEQENPLLKQVTFVLLGVAKPIQSGIYVWNSVKSIELKGLTGDCLPLQEGLKKVSKNTKKLMENILSWTGGQPFLTQLLCSLISQSKKIQDGTDFNIYVSEVVANEIIKSWRNHDCQNHFKEIENWFVLHDTESDKGRLFALRLYKGILEEGSLEISSVGERSRYHWDLLTSGIVSKEGDQLKVTNRIYEHIFNLTWVLAKEKQLIEGISNMADLGRVYGREVYTMVDQGGKMAKTDGKATSRWHRMQDQLLGDVGMILDYSSDGVSHICEEIILFPYNTSRPRGSRYVISKPDDLDSFFSGNKPVGGSNVTPSLEKAFDEWLSGREKVTREEVEADLVKAAMFIIYISGQFDDASDFENLLKQMCKKIDDQRIFKVIIIGVGDDVPVKYFNEIDTNKRKNQPLFKDMHGENCNIAVFEKAEELTSDLGIVEVMQRQLQGDPNDPDKLSKSLRN